MSIRPFAEISQTCAPTSKMTTIYLSVSLAVFGFAAFVAATDQEYDGYKVLRCFPESRDQVERLKTLEFSKELNDGIDFWSRPGIHKSVDMMVSPDDADKLMDKLTAWNLPCEEFMEDVGEAAKKTIEGSDVLLSWNSDDASGDNKMLQPNFYSQYQPYSVIENKITHMATNNPNVTLDVLGKSSEGRNIYLVKMSRDFSKQRPVILIDAGHHAREWISHSTLVYLMDILVGSEVPTYRGKERPRGSNLSNSSAGQKVDDGNDDTAATKTLATDEMRSLLDRFDFWFVPVVNPDGYVYSMTHDRMWRKTRSYRGFTCYGVDLNRNYPSHWGVSGTSLRRCSDIYQGPEALSEPEAEAVDKAMKLASPRLSMYLTLHAYSQMILYPYGYGRLMPPNHQDLARVARAGQDAMFPMRQTVYSAGVTSYVLYEAAGGSDDHAYENHNVKYSFTIELPDKGNYGFLLPPAEIVPVGEETSEGIYAMVQTMETIVKSRQK